MVAGAQIRTQCLALTLAKGSGQTLQLDGQESAEVAPAGKLGGLGLPPAGAREREKTKSATPQGPLIYPGSIAREQEWRMAQTEHGVSCCLTLHQEQGEEDGQC